MLFGSKKNFKIVMMNIIVIILVAMVFYYPVKDSMHKAFSVEEKLNDFEYLYTALKDNYGQFEYKENKYGFNWSAKKTEYIEKIKNTRNDYQFLVELNNFAMELKDYHLYLLSPEFYEMHCKVFKDNVDKFQDILKPRIEILESVESKYLYWEKVVGKRLRSSLVSSDGGFKSYGYTIEHLKDVDAVYMKIPAFLLTTKECEEIKDYLLENSAANIIIDIRGNPGGSDFVWMDYIIPAIISEDTISRNYSLIKNTELINGYVTHYDVRDIETLPKTIQIDKNIEGVFSQYIYSENKISPFDKIKRYENLYVLIDGDVYSAGSNFTSWVKNTGVGIVIGANTLGGGGMDGAYIPLPNTGLCVRVDFDLSLNMDGTINTVDGIPPDISCLPSNALEEAVKHIKSRK